MPLSLENAAHWSPFHLDALGIVTLLGAEEVSTAVGALEHSRYTEYLPLFGTYLIAENKFTRPIPGFALYNISDGVYVPILNGWFSRWLIANLSAKVTILEWNVVKRRGSKAKEFVSGVIGILANGGLIALASLQGDYYGLANVIAMALSVLVRKRMVHENIKHLDQMVDTYARRNDIFFKNSDDNLVKIVIKAPEDKVIAFTIQRGLLACLFLDLDLDMKPPKKSEDKKDGNRSTEGLRNNPTVNDDTERGPVAALAGSTEWLHRKGMKRKSVVQNTREKTHSFTYTSARAVGWVAFACHVVSIGLSTLLTQMLSIGLLLGATLLRIYGVGNNDSEIGGRLTITKIQEKKSHNEAFLYLTIRCKCRRPHKEIAYLLCHESQ